MSRYRKTLTALAGAVVQLANAALIHGTAGQVVAVLAAVVTGAGVYQVPNAA